LARKKGGEGEGKGSTLPALHEIPIVDSLSPAWHAAVVTRPTDINGKDMEGGGEGERKIFVAIYA